MEQTLVTKSALIEILSDLFAKLNDCEIRQLAGTHMVDVVVWDDFIGSPFLARCVKMPQFCGISHRVDCIEFNFVADIL